LKIKRKKIEKMLIPGVVSLAKPPMKIFLQENEKMRIVIREIE